MVNNKISVKSSWSERHFNTHQGVGGDLPNYTEANTTIKDGNKVFIS